MLSISFTMYFETYFYENTSNINLISIVYGFRDQIHIESGRDKKRKKGKDENISGGPILSSSTFSFLADPLKITNFVNFLKFFLFCHLSWSGWQIKNFFNNQHFNKFAGGINYVCCSLNIKKGINYTSCGITFENVANKCHQLIYHVFWDVFLWKYVKYKSHFLCLRF
jgi:hypothetical protein